MKKTSLYAVLAFLTIISQSANSALANSPLPTVVKSPVVVIDCYDDRQYNGGVVLGRPGGFVKCEDKAESLNISASGRVSIKNAEVTQVLGGNSFTVRVWGLTLNAVINNTGSVPTLQVVPGSETPLPTTPASPVVILYPMPSVGDRVDLHGSIDQSNGTVRVENLVNRTNRNKEAGELEKKIKALMEQLEELKRQMRNLKGKPMPEPLRATVESTVTTQAPTATGNNQ